MQNTCLFIFKERANLLRLTELLDIAITWAMLGRSSGVYLSERALKAGNQLSESEKASILERLLFLKNFSVDVYIQDTISHTLDLMPHLQFAKASINHQALETLKKDYNRCLCF